MHLLRLEYSSMITRRTFLRRTALLATSLLAASCDIQPQSADPPTPSLPTAPARTPNRVGPTRVPEPKVVPPSPTTIASPAPSPTLGVEVEAERLLGRMSLEQKVGQVMIVAFRDAAVSPIISEMVHDRHVGGVILFTQNLSDPQHARKLTDALQALATGSGAGIPLFTAMDQEGGVIYRSAAGATVWPSQMLLGAAGDGDLLDRCARMTAAELRALGINVNFAPVLDINNNPANPVIGTRSFGADPRAVAALGVRAIAAYQGAGVVAVGKHFPGHGDTDVDSHLSLPVIDKSPGDLEAFELVPFRAAIAAGVDAIMTAHIDLPRISGGEPATLAPQVLTTLLRKHMGFDGLIITDDLEMGAIVEGYGTAEAALRAFRAGADLLLFRFTEGQQRRAYDLLLDAAQREPALAARLDDSVQRIVGLKLRRGLFAPSPAPPLAIVGAAEHQAAAVAAAAAGLTLVRNDARLLPLRPGPDERLLVLAPDPDDLANVEVPAPNALTLGAAIARRHPATTAMTYRLDPDEQQRAELVSAAGGAALVIIGTYDAQLYPGQPALVEALVSAGVQLVVVSLRLPYDLGHLPAITTYLAAYDDRTPTLIAVADALFGARAPMGHLPVPLGEQYPIGYSLRDYTTPEVRT
jgi:beta-N-acetylhexosaminidase